MNKLWAGLKAAFALSAFALSFPAAATTTIYLGGSGGSGTDGNSITKSEDGSTVRASGWAVDGSGTIEDGALGQWSSGVGVQNSDGDNSHTIDNYGWTDFIVLQFDSPVILETVRFTTGWYDSNGMLINDTDATIGYGNLVIPISESPNWDEVLAATAFAGFNFIDSASSGNGSQTRAVNPAQYAANTWIIMASNTNVDQIADGFKVKYVTFSSAVPEPATWLMLLLGFGLIGGVLRHKRQQERFAFA